MEIGKNLIPNNVDTFIIDFDDTLVDTSKTFISVFENLKEEFCEVYEENKLGDGAKVYDEFIFACYYPEGMFYDDVDMRMISEKFIDFISNRDGISDEDSSKLKSLIKSVYEKDIDPHEGSIDFIKTLSNRGKNICIWTHSGQEWGERKVKRFFDEAGIPFEEIYLETVPLEDRKDSDGLSKLVFKLEEHFATKKENMVIVGDNPVADIGSAKEVLSHAIWVNRAMPEGYEYRKDTVDDFDSLNVRVVSHLDDIVSLLSDS